MNLCLCQQNRQPVIIYGARRNQARRHAYTKDQIHRHFGHHIGIVTLSVPPFIHSLIANLHTIVFSFWYAIGQYLWVQQRHCIMVRRHDDLGACTTRHHIPSYHIISMLLIPFIVMQYVVSIGVSMNIYQYLISHIQHRMIVC
jgi:hypothetical protein